MADNEKNKQANAPKREVWTDDQEITGALFEFEAKDDELVGVLTKVDYDVKLRNGTSNRYTIKDDDGVSWVVIGTALINQKLANAEIGSRVRILRTDPKDDTTTAGGKMKGFRVWVKPA